MSATAPATESPASEVGALYNRYRPKTMAEVIGQDAVSVPLGRALAKGSVHHAMLLSGPAGCGKTSTARILAKAMLCDQAPTDTPCNECVSCEAMDAGNCVDYIEIDAASQGSVEDARNLREKAIFAPVHSAVKVIVIDEAHMVTTQGFNALLKVVEEPPSFLRFIFATTEPDKVISTIRSRTHNYKFRSVQPRVLVEHLARVAEIEGATVEDGVLPLLVRAAGGSVRNSLSLLGQLLNGSWAGRVTREEAAGLLGATSDAVLDEVLVALANRDTAGMIRSVGAAIEEGADAKRLAEDLLDRFRDLHLLMLTGEVPPLAALAGEGRVAAWREVASRLGERGLTGSAEVLTGVVQAMPGGQLARYALEVACSRMQINLTDTMDVPGMVARIEQALAGAALPAATPVQTVPAQAIPAQPVPVQPVPAVARPIEEAPPMAAPSIRIPGSGSPARPQTPAPAPVVAAPVEPVDEWAPPTTGAAAAVTDPATDPWSSAPTAEPSSTSAPQTAPAAPGGVVDEASWQQILQAVLGRPRGRTSHTLLSNNATVVSLGGGRIVLRFASPKLASRARDDGHLDSCGEAAAAVLGGTWTVSVEAGQ